MKTLQTFDIVVLLLQIEKLPEIYERQPLFRTFSMKIE